MLTDVLTSRNGEKRNEKENFALLECLPDQLFSNFAANFVR